MAIVGGGQPGLLTAVAVRHACPGVSLKAGLKYTCKNVLSKNVFLGIKDDEKANCEIRTEAICMVSCFSKTPPHHVI